MLTASLSLPIIFGEFDALIDELLSLNPQFVKFIGLPS